MTRIFTQFSKKFNFLLVSTALFFSFFTVNAQPVDQTFNSSGTYIIPTGWTATVSIETWGAGGSGGGGGTSANERYGGGGGGYARLVTTLVAGSYSVTVGVGGIAPTSSNNGQAGGSSGFAGLVSATGGTGGTNTAAGVGGNGNAGTGITIHKGGNGGAPNAGGTGGGGGGSAQAGANGVNGAVGGTVIFGFGAGGNGGTGQGTGGNGGGLIFGIGLNGADATAPGGGGGGKADGAAKSGNGANGRVIVTVQLAQSALPVKFGQLTASQQTNGVNLEWTSYSEENTDHYEVEHSSDGQSFSVIGKVKAAGNSNARLEYSWLDETPNNGNNFYRVRSVDIDGHLTYSAVIKLSIGEVTPNKTINIYPNPVKGSQLTVQFNSLQKGNYSAQLFSYTGQQLSQSQINISTENMSQTIQLPSSIKPGVYNLVITNGTLKLNKTFIVE